MENQDLKIGIKTVWILIIVNVLLVFLGVLAKLEYWEFSNFLFIAGLILFLSTWIIVLSDMVKNKIPNKFFWIFSMFATTPITPIVYLIQRKKLLRIGN